MIWINVFRSQPVVWPRPLILLVIEAPLSFLSLLAVIEDERHLARAYFQFRAQALPAGARRTMTT